MPAPNTLKLTVAEVDYIIQATEQAIQQMTAVNSQVTYLAPSVQNNNQSTSGQIILRRLNNWSDDYPKIVNDMTNINNAVHAMRNALVSGSDWAASVAAGGQAG